MTIFLDLRVTYRKRWGVEKYDHRLYASGNMDETKSMLRAIINGQSAMKQELLGEIRKVDDKVEKLDQKVDSLSEELKKVESNLTKRINKIGLQVARLEDDTPTREEFADLNSRVKKVEQITTSV